MTPRNLGNKKELAELLQGLMADTNRCVKGNWIVPEIEEIEAILADYEKAQQQIVKICECGHNEIQHMRFSDHDECSGNECDCDTLRPIARPSDSGQEQEKPCDKIFDHKWLDPECIENGCQSLFLKELRDIIGEPSEGSHHDEWKPRAETWHKERKNWSSEVDTLRQQLLALQNKIQAQAAIENKEVCKPLVSALKTSNQMLVACSESAKILKRIDLSGGWQKAEQGILELIQSNNAALAKVEGKP